MSSTSLSPHTNYGYCNISFYSMLQMTMLSVWQCYTMDGLSLWKEDVNMGKCFNRPGGGRGYQYIFLLAELTILPWGVWSMGNTIN